MANTDTLQMKEAIIASIDNPTELERIYRINKTGFTQAFESVYPDIRENAIAQAWPNYRKYFQLMKSVFIPATSHSWFFLF